MVDINVKQIFLSYSSPDQDQVEQIARRLDREGYKVWYDNASLVPGESWSDALDKGLRGSSHCLVFVGSDRLNPWQHEEVRTAINRAVRERSEFRLIPVLLPGVKTQPGESELPEGIMNRHWVQFKTSVDEEDAWRRLISGLQGREPGLPLEGETGPCPYRGIGVFNVDDADNFYGRRSITDSILARLRERVTQPGHPRFFAIIGPSGTGKSSLARAGVMAGIVKKGMLDDCGRWVHPPLIFKPGTRPLHALALELIKHDATRQRFSPWSVAEIESKLREPVDGEHRFLSDEVAAALQGDAYLPVLVDQFEELLKPLTMSASGDEEAQRNLEKYHQNQLLPFVGNLFFAARQTPGRLLFIVTMRDDFYGQCAFDQRLAALVSENHKLLTPMTPDELRESVEQPARLNGKAVEPALLALIQSDMHNRPGAMPLLQDALEQLWDRCGKTLTSRVYTEEVGGIKGSLKSKADHTYGGLTDQSRLATELRQRRESLIRQLFLDLVDQGSGVPTSRRRDRSELPDDTEMDEILDAFVNARLLLKSHDKASDKTYFELTHEALIENWPKLKDWLKDKQEDDQIRQRLEQEAARYANEQEQYQDKPEKWRQIEPEFLMKNKRWVEMAHWLEGNPVSPSQLAVRFIDRCRTYSQEQKARSWKRGGLALLGLMIVVLLVSFSYVKLTHNELQISVVDTEGKAIDDYRLFVSKERSTLADGSVRWFRSIFVEPNQNYWLRIERDGYFQSERETLTGHAGSTKELELTLYPQVAPEMVEIEEGEFDMGSDPENDSDAGSDEQPQHHVEIKPFYLGKYEVTFADYTVFANATGRELPDDEGWGRDRRSVINVTWADAVAYAEWLSQQTGKRYRLPTEAEWEYAARAGSTTNYSWGDDIRQDNKVWANCDGCGSQWDGKQTAPVGSFEPNAFSLYDMAGNVWEWTQDCWHDDYQNAPSDGSAWLESEQVICGRRVVRGGSWNGVPRSLRSAYRVRFNPVVRFDFLGFRLAQDP
ncbi:nSTAND1 domain-containing NTPase [Candidatus Thiodiazotropha sp. CDECU1]|uniref:nSTAND1 domain-containing NTPase n=1 Tax=Candidatus Thiodiazotropha sp. CDECU1 TaxID=3065865 RepID=UPI00292F785D|nr:SUMF1/EgtB/PvdO family nonheme iron enzyme [Candidatus Thiodiazotropha sp. CDECU1]